MSTDVNHGLNSAVGTILRRRREALDLELAQIARTLRIRRDYLAALENNTLEGLPGPTYAVGFLRTYSEYLGLDGVDMVQRYKATTDVLNDKPSLTFPMPLTERGVPGGGLFLLTTLVLIGLGYGTWYYISSGRHQTLATVEPVPAQLAAIAPPPQQQAPHTPGAPATAATNVAGNAAP
ncbi:MAG TPA: helix-turn-helix domain-containing protein, partial [Stellaceae bacterium]|nr:helix-turn-helix domain-containing protein [Stellaceae bacterium]